MKQTIDAFDDVPEPSIAKYVCAPCSNCKGQIRDLFSYFNIGEQYNIDLAVFNLGAYEPRWFMAPSHINPRETVRAFKELRAEKILVVHWGTFRLGDEPVHFPPLQFHKELKKEGLLDVHQPVKQSFLF